MAKLIISRDGVVTDTLFIDKPILAIGSAADNDVRLTSVGISRHHARIASVVNDDILEDLASANGTLINGESVKQRVLQNDDVIEIADYQIRYRNHRAVEGPSFDQTMVIQTLGIERDTMMTREAVVRSKRKQRGAYASRRTASLRDLRVPEKDSIELSQLLSAVGVASVGLAVINARPHGYFITHVAGPKRARLNGQALGGEARALANDDVIEVGEERLQFVSK
jgi:pSer/pThr/pTyr-binding forkhead associated (FHA) protein